MNQRQLRNFLEELKLPAPDSHKGQNGKLMIIGGSDLFHAASKWSLDIASKFVDMVFYSSVPQNNILIRQAKGHFWNGIVVEREALAGYIDEADCILIGPGMTRIPETQKMVNALLKEYPTKKWVIDAGALQMMDPMVLTETCIVTPHARELEQVLTNFKRPADIYDLLNRGATVVLKGREDIVYHDLEKYHIKGGNAGMTKGGTGDVLAGLIAGLYCTNDKLVSAVIGSYINKKAGDLLHQSVGPFFNASDLVEAIPRALWQELAPTTQSEVPDP